MPLFEELSLDTIKQDGEIFVNSRQLSWHIAKAMREFHEETRIGIATHGITEEDKNYSYGIIQGMNSIVMMLAQGGAEEDLKDNINTVEDIFKYLGEYDE